MAPTGDTLWFQLQVKGIILRDLNFLNVVLRLNLHKGHCLSTLSKLIVYYEVRYEMLTVHARVFLNISNLLLT
jgi:hypothetical protein